MQTTLNDVRKAELQSMRQTAPGSIIAMYEEVAAEAGKEFPPRPTSFSRMIEAIIDHENAKSLGEHPSPAF